VLRDPDPSMPASSWKMAMVVDLLVHGEFIHVLVADRILVRLDPATCDVQGEGSRIDRYVSGGQGFDPVDVIHVKFFNPLNPKRGLSPLTSMRDIIIEDIAASRHRTQIWNGGNPGSWISRGTVEQGIPEWSDKARERFTTYFKGRKADDTPVLEDGMELHVTERGAHGDEYVASRAFVLTTICGVLGVPSQSASLTDRNLDAAHRALYTDAIAPLASLIADGLNRQLVPRLLGPVQTAGGRIFVRFDLDDKLRGSFREEADAFSVALGGAAYLVPNEVRKIKGYPPVEGGDVLPPPGKAPSNQAVA
jgi:HK97 family phage portal protein